MNVQQTLFCQVAEGKAPIPASAEATEMRYKEFQKAVIEYFDGLDGNLDDYKTVARNLDELSYILGNDQQGKKRHRNGATTSAGL